MSGRPATSGKSAKTTTHNATPTKAAPAKGNTAPPKAANLMTTTTTTATKGAAVPPGTQRQMSTKTPARAPTLVAPSVKPVGRTSPARPAPPRVDDGMSSDGDTPSPKTPKVRPLTAFSIANMSLSKIGLPPLKQAPLQTLAKARFSTHNRSGSGSTAGSQLRRSKKTNAVQNALQMVPPHSTPTAGLQAQYRDPMSSNYNNAGVPTSRPTTPGHTTMTTADATVAQHIAHTTTNSLTTEDPTLHTMQTVEDTQHHLRADRDNVTQAVPAPKQHTATTPDTPMKIRLNPYDQQREVIGTASIINPHTTGPQVEHRGVETRIRRRRKQHGNPRQLQQLRMRFKASRKAPVHPHHHHHHHDIAPLDEDLVAQQRGAATHAPLRLDENNESYHDVLGTKYMRLMGDLEGVDLHNTNKTSPMLKAMVTGVAGTTPYLQPLSSSPSPAHTPNLKTTPKSTTASLQNVTPQQMPHLQLNGNSVM